MAEQTLTIKNWGGGLSDDDKFGLQDSFSGGFAVDFRRSPSILKLHRKAVKESGAIVTTEITDMARTDENGGNVYMAGDSKIYKRTPGADGGLGTYSKVADAASDDIDHVRDLDYRPDIDTLFAFDADAIHELYPVTNTPTWAFRKYKEYVSQSVSASGQAYDIPIALTETEFLQFTCEKEPLKSVSLLVNTKGTGNWTITLHDAANHLLATVTVAAADVPAAGQRIDFVFATPLRLKIDGIYHFHVTSNVADGKLEASGGSITPATLTTNLTGANNDLKYTASLHGTEGNNITIEYIDPAANDVSIQVTVSVNAIKVRLQTDGAGAILSLADDVRLAIQTHAIANSLVDIENAGTDDGTGVVTAMAATNLTGGVTTMDSIDYQLEAVRLIDTGTFGHSTAQYGAKTLFCNERYLGEWEPLSNDDNSTFGYDPHKLTFPAECITIGICGYTEYRAIACAIKRTTDSTNAAPTEGKIFLWDGVADQPTTELDIPQGAPWGLFSQDNVLYWNAAGQWYRWAGGDIEMVYEFPGVDNFQSPADAANSDIYLKAARHSMCTKDSLVLFGFPYQTANLNSEIGVYSFGQSKGYLPKAIGLDYLLSTGHKQVQYDTGGTPDTPITGISCLKRFGSNIFLAWHDRVASANVYGVDLINSTNPSAPTASFESLQFDNGRPDKEKTAKVLRIELTSFPSGLTITPKVKFDRAADWTYGDPVSTTDSDYARLTFTDKSRFKEIILGFDITSDGNDIGVVAGVFKFDDNEAEQSDT